MNVQRGALRPLYRIAASAVIAWGLIGCGSDNPETYAVSGVVQFKGKPLANVGVTFTPWDGAAGRSAIGRTDENGRFTLSTFNEGDGAVKGTHRVTIAVVAAATEGTTESSADDYAPPPPPPFPRKYLTTDRSDIEVTVPSDTESGEVTIELKE